MLLAVSACKKDEVKFNIIPPFAGGLMTLNGIAGTEKGENAANSVFVDFSKNTQLSITRKGWDLGLYTGADYKVILNHSAGATAIQLNKNDLNQVTAADSTAAVVTSLTLGQSLSAVDALTGDFSSYLNGTVIKDIAENDADNKVFLINSGVGGGLGGGDNLTNNRAWTKVRITRLKNGYTINYAGINDVGFRTITVIKDPAYNFKYMSFNSSFASGEPGKKDWDIEWGGSTYLNAAGSPVAEPDFVLINFGAGVTAAQIIFSGPNANSTIAYTDFQEANLTGITFLGTRDVIGKNWRNTDPASVIAVYTDRYYLVQDPAGNIYKLRFNKFNASDGGSRGRPLIEFAVVKQAPAPMGQ